jgi:competence protein ComEA
MRELMTLELIGEVRAQKIIEYRKKNGLFRSPEDLTKVRSIGDKIYLLNKDRITVR